MTAGAPLKQEIEGGGSLTAPEAASATRRMRRTCGQEMRCRTTGVRRIGTLE